MIAYIEQNSAQQCASVNFFQALTGLQDMGWEIRYFQHLEQIENHQRDELLVASIQMFRNGLSRLGIEPPAPFDYPEELLPFLGRKIWKSTVDTIANNPDSWNVFIKPAVTTKKFTGRLVKSTKDLVGCGHQLYDTEVWCSEPVEFVSEWRCFVTYGRIKDVRPYKGNWRLHFDYQIIENAVKAFQSAPAAYALDFGLNSKGETLLVEANDGYSLGCYGLFPLDYAKLLSARWAELTQTTDYCNF